MGSVETAFIVAAVLSIIILGIVLIKFKNIKFVFVVGLAIIAVMLALVLYASKNPKNEPADVLLIPTGAPMYTENVPVSTDGIKVPGTSDDLNGSPMSPDIGSPEHPTETPSSTNDSNVYKTPVSTVTADPNTGKNSTIYLTFDDGPSQRTTEVLDILQKYNVKATFFIINFDDSQIPILKRMIDEGHSIAIHGYSHVYGDIYKSEDAFMENVTKLRNKIKEKLGYDTTLTRFPGGSSSSIAERTCPGIMTKLILRLGKDGYQYFDWNVDSRDAERFDSAGIINSVTSTTKATREANIVLMHDSEDKKETVKSLSAIIEWGLANGYSFSNLNSSSPTAHHRSAN